MPPERFVLKISDAAIADLKNRLALTRFPDSAPGEPWAYGTSVEYIRDLVSCWKDSFDWRTQEAALNEFPQFKVLVARHRPALPPRSRRRPDAIPSPAHAWLARLSLRIPRHHSPTGGSRSIRR
jgi:hypothetical protein